MEELRDKEGRLLHIVYKREDLVAVEGGRQNISPDSQFLQLAALNVRGHKMFRAHRHIEHIRETNLTEECWIVVAGKVTVYYYDLDDRMMGTRILCAGDCTITFAGGHTYEILEGNALIYEIKNGPYDGQENDKVFIGD